MSWMIWPQLENWILSPRIALMMISASPSRVTYSKPSSFANNNVHVAASTSTISIEAGNGFFCDNAVIIKLFSFLIIEPKPTTISLTNTAPSKLILYQPIGGVAIWLALQQEEPTADLDEFFETPSHFREPLNWSYSLELSFHSSILCFYETRAVR